MTELRLILLLLGILVVAAVYLYTRVTRARRGEDPSRDGSEPPPSETLGRHRIGQARAPDLDPSELEALARDIRLSGRPGTGEDPDSDPGRAAGRDDGPEMIVALHVAFRGGRAPLSRVIEVLHKEGLAFGEFGIFHLPAARGDVPVFSVANMVEPGTLDPDSDEGSTLPGVSLFLRLPGPEDGVGAFARMLATARRLAQTLGGEVLDAHRSALSRQTARHLREEIIEFQRRLRAREGRGRDAGS